MSQKIKVVIRYWKEYSPPGTIVNGLCDTDLIKGLWAIIDCFYVGTYYTTYLQKLTAEEEEIYKIMSD